MKTAVVLGAGITGLRIALYLAEAGYKVKVIEKTSKIGGMTSSFQYKDFILDYGPHKFYTQLPGVYEDFKKIVGEGNYLSVEKKNSIRLLGNYLDFPVKLPQLFKSIGPVLAAKIGLDLIREKIKSYSPKNYEEYFVKGFGRTGYEIVFEGFANKVWGNPKYLSEELARRRSPAKSVFDVLKTALIKSDQNVSAENFLYPKKGYGVMCQKLSEKIIKLKGEVILDSTTKEIFVEKNKVSSIEIVSKNGKSKKIKCDVLVSTMSITELPLLIKGAKLGTEEINSLEKLKFRSLIIAYVFLKKKRALKDNWIFFPEREFCFNRVAEQKSFSQFTCPEDRTVLTAEITCDFGDKTYNSTEDEIKNKVVKDLVKAGLIEEDEVYDFITRKAGRVYPVYSMDYKKNLKSVLDWLDKISNIYTVGRLGLFNYNNADHCLDMAKVTARVIEEDRGSESWKRAREYFDSYRIVD